MQETVTNNEKKLLLKVAGGDEQAFEQLFVSWQPLFSSYIYSITKSKEHTAEIVQDVFLKVWLHREKLPGVENFKAYLYAISRNEAVNALRNIMREIKLMDEWEKMQKSETADFFLNENQQHRQLEYIEEAIERLSARQKEIYQLHRHEKLTYQQIAERLGIGKETVKTHLENAINAIKKHLNSRLAIFILLSEEISKKI